jgi:hypothetical protein
MMTAMPFWLATVLVALATTVVLNVTVGPRLEARNRRIQAAHRSRDQFSASVSTILAATDRLQGVDYPDKMSPTVRAALQAERDRWITQINDTTQYLIDNLELYALGYISSLPVLRLPCVLSAGCYANMPSASR